MKKITVYICALFLLQSCSKNSPLNSQTGLDTIVQNKYDKGIAFQEDFDHVAEGWSYYSTDTVCTTIVKFVALDSPVLSYHWRIGAKTYNTKEVSLLFPSEFLLSSEKVAAQLSITYKKEDYTDTSVTFNKTVTFFNPCNIRFNGVFKGVLDNNNATRDSFSINTCAWDLLDHGLFVTHYNTGCGRYYTGADGFYLGYKRVVFNSGGNAECGSPTGIVAFHGDTIVIKYSAYDNGFFKPPVNHVFKGF